MEKRIKSLKSTFAFLFVISFLYTWNARAAELPAATKAQLHQIIGKLEKAGAQVGLEIDDLGTVKNPQQFPAQNDGISKVLFSYRATQSYMSASNWKLFTAFYALNSDVPDSARDTEVLSDSNIEDDGTLKGNLYLVGHSDPSLNIEQLRQAASALKEKGLRRITGDVVVTSGFSAETLGGRYPFGWTLDDALWYYAPPISTLAINRNQVDVYVTGGANQDVSGTVRYSPALPDLQIMEDIRTGTADLKNKSADDLLHFDRLKEGGEGFSVRGTVAPGQQLTEGIALSDPSLMAAKVLLNELQMVGIKVDGAANERFFRNIIGVKQFPSYTISAPSIKVLLTRMLKHSDNLYAEMLLRSVYYSSHPVTSDNPYLQNRDPKNFDLLRQEMMELLDKNNVNTAGLRMEDGSGLSRYSLITPRAMTQLLNAAQKLPKDKADIFWNALPIAGVDGTLGKRMKSTFAQNNVRAKTGTFSTACNLSGYVTTRDGHRLAVSFLTNFGPETDICRAAQDETFELLAAKKLS
jgi:PBP4 family serine-type D-alanyl-D-alanine carboxypeptidase